MDFHFIVCQCNCGKKYYKILEFEEVLSILNDTKSKIAKQWSAWATDYTCGEVCARTDCDISNMTPSSKALLTEDKLTSDFCRYVQDKASSARRNAARSGAGKTTAAQFVEISQMQGYLCYYCLYDLRSHPDWYDPGMRGQIANREHLQPLTRGGTHWPVNIVLSCKRCNEEKGAMTDQEYWRHRKKCGFDDGEAKNRSDALAQKRLMLMRQT